MKSPLGERVRLSKPYPIDLRLYVSLGAFLRKTYFGYWSLPGSKRPNIDTVFARRAVG